MIGVDDDVMVRTKTTLSSRKAALKSFFISNKRGAGAEEEGFDDEGFDDGALGREGLSVKL